MASFLSNAFSSQAGKVRSPTALCWYGSAGQKENAASKPTSPPRSNDSSCFGCACDPFMETSQLPAGVMASAVTRGGPNDCVLTVNFARLHYLNSLQLGMLLNDAIWQEGKQRTSSPWVLEIKNLEQDLSAKAALMVGRMLFMNRQYVSNLAAVRLIDCSLSHGFLHDLATSLHQLREIHSSTVDLTDLEIDCSTSSVPAILSVFTSLTRLVLKDYHADPNPILKSMNWPPNLQSLELARWSKLLSPPEATFQPMIYYHADDESQTPIFVPKLPELRKLTLSQCEALVTLPSSISNLNNLTELDLRLSKSLRQLPTTFGDTVSLRKLELGWCRMLLSLPPSISQLVDLEELNLSGCRSLVEIPDQVMHLKSLHTLSAKWCRCLSYLPDGVCDMDGLVELDLEGCQGLMQLPEDIGHLPSLRSLNLKCCVKLERLPHSLLLLPPGVVDLDSGVNMPATKAGKADKQQKLRSGSDEWAHIL